MRRASTKPLLEIVPVALIVLSLASCAMAQDPHKADAAMVEQWLEDVSNWGRWGDNDQLGTLNLITPEKRRAAAALVRSGRTVSLSRPFPVTPSQENPQPAQHFMMKNDRPGGWGSATDYYGIRYHGVATTHIDALCHMWNADGMWDGRDPDDTITSSGSTYGTIDQWSDGILTRGVLLDVPKHRGRPYVTREEPVQGWELDEIAREEGVSVGPGDAVIVFSGASGSGKTTLLNILAGYDSPSAGKVTVG